jgi:hypothetical protein
MSSWLLLAKAVEPRNIGPDDEVTVNGERFG